MASIVKLGKGKQPPRAIDFAGSDGKRKRLRLGIVTHSDAEVAKRRIERLLTCNKLGSEFDNQSLEWLSGLSDEIHQRVARFGLCESRKKSDDVQPTKLGPFLDTYIASRAIRKQNTRRNYLVSKNHLVEYFGSEKPLAEITAGDADDWKHWLAMPTTDRKALGDATIGREVKRARQFFRAAARKKLISESPFADLSAPAQLNTSREFFVTQETTAKVIESCPDAEWRLIVAPSRYGGLRCPSEHLSLRWEDVDWLHDRVTIRSPKTEHHTNGESRQIPLFPELRPYLEDARELAEPRQEYVITRYRDKNANLRTQLLRIIKLAGVTPWPKLFQNLRASRETELVERFPIHVVCAWIGNTEKIAAKHYLQVRDSDFERAAESAVAGCRTNWQRFARNEKNPEKPG